MNNFVLKCIKYDTRVFVWKFREESFTNFIFVKIVILLILSFDSVAKGLEIFLAYSYLKTPICIILVGIGITL